MPYDEMMIDERIGYACRTFFVHIDGTLNSFRCISVVLRPVALLLLRTVRNATFQQAKAQTCVICIVGTFLGTENVQLLSSPAPTPDLSPRKNV